MRFGTDGDGNYGYYGADDSLIPFKRGVSIDVINGLAQTDSFTATVGHKYIVSVGMLCASGESAQLRINGATIISSSNVYYTRAHNSVINCIRTFYIEATSTTVLVNIRPGDGNKVYQSITYIDLGV